MSSISQTFRCPQCPPSSRTFSSHGLKVHTGHKHKEHLPLLQALPATQPVAAVSQVPVLSPLDRLKGFRRCTPVLRHIPKAARNQAAGKLSNIIDKCVSNNGSDDWYSLFTFAYSALCVPQKSEPGSMTTKVKRNIQSSVECMDLSGSVGRFNNCKTVDKVIISKVFEGDLRGAVRLLVSDDTFAQNNATTLEALKQKHPSPSRPLDFPPAPDRSYTPLTVTAHEVALAIGSFYTGSAAGLDGIRPGHLKELTSCSAGENGPRLLESLTNLSNFLLSGQLNVEICPYLYGASLCALAKKDGGVRPIAIGSVLRRLVAKLACRAVREPMSLYFQPHQLGFGTQRGCEAAIHATRAFALNPTNSDCVMIKIDVRNAFNTLERDTLLSEARDKIPTIYPFLYQVYSSSSNLFFGEDLITSQVGAQQGDPLGPLVFSLGIHNIITKLKSPLNVWYLDDGTIAGPPEVVYQDLEVIISQFKTLGLEVNPAKCEFFPCSAVVSSKFTSFSALLPGIREISQNTFTLLGSPIFMEAVPDAIASKLLILLAIHERLKLVPAHVAITLIRMCFALPKITYLLRTTPTWLCVEEVTSFDDALKSVVESVLNVALNDTQWRQASLPIRYGGLGIRCARDVGLPAFLASAHGVANLVTVLLRSNGDLGNIPFVSDAMSAWSVLNSGVPCPEAKHVQRAWDDVGVKRFHKQLLEDAVEVDRARLRAVSQPESGAWLHALPSPHLGTFLDDDSLRVAVALRLGCKVCEPHVCTCGTMVGADGHHALSCRRCSGRFSRHHALNDIVRRALNSANIPCVLEPVGLSRSDGKRPDGLTLVPWKNGKCLIWDATCVCTFAASHLSRTIHSPSAAAEDACRSKKQKYTALETLHHFVPVAVETMGSWSGDAKDFVRELGRRINEKTGDTRSGSFLVQRLAIAIQRGNAASVMGTFAPGAIRGGLFD